MSRRADARGLTALEAAAGFAVLGSILLVGVPAFVKELHASKQAEATINVALLGDDAIAHAIDKPTASAFPASAPLTPSTVPRGVREADAPGAWDHPTWVALGFRPFAEGVPHAYAFQLDTTLSPAKSTFRALAHGDLDGDGTTSTFEVRGVAEDGSPARVEPGMIVEAELECEMRDFAAATLIVAVGAVAVGSTQPRLARELHDSKAKEDVWVLPPAAQLEVGTLGHKSAMVDWLWSTLIVQWSIHLTEKRPFPDVFYYLDAILALEPDYGPLYQYVDTLLCFRVDGGDAAAARSARQYLERGIQERPGDADTWLHYGQFLAYMSPTYVPDGPEQEEWQRTGALAITKAVDLGSEASRALSAATLLSRYGEKDAAIRSLQRAHALTDNPMEREDIENKLSQLSASMQRDEAQDDTRFIETQWKGELPFVSRGTFMLLGPITDPAKCAGPGSSFVSGCERSWGDALPSSKMR